ncbi:hypothetical protein [Streptomyces pseudogriseolus]|uniref:hypothetical protein n=1 Tax=Streptomyces pseudogriseolus TaxID=36817 RepID=UPI003FA2C408
MSSPMVRRETVRDIEAICRLDLDSRILRRRIADRLTRLIPADSYCFSTIDPMTLLTADQVSAGLVPEAAAAAAYNEYLVDDVLKFAALARSEVSAGTLGAATGGDPESSHRYRTVLPMIDARHELRAGFVVDGRCWGVVALFRGGRRPDFTPADVGVLRRLSAPVGAALRRAAHRAPDDNRCGPVRGRSAPARPGLAAVFGEPGRETLAGGAGPVAGGTAVRDPGGGRTGKRR